jgi:diguanylate cyclase (GGDEF)-like protein
VDGPPSDPRLEALLGRIDALENRVHELDERVRELERSGTKFRRALNRLGDALASTQDRPAMLSAVLETCALYAGASAAVFYGVVAGSDRLRALATFGETDEPSVVGDLQRGEGVAGAAADTDTLVVWPGAGTTVERAAAEPRHATAVALPIRSGGRPFGVLALYQQSADRPFTTEDVEALASLTRQVETAIESTFLFEEAARQSLTDGLTSLWNRRQFDLRLEAEYQRGQRFGETFSVVLLDLDQMKAVNDAQGHQAGDALLIELARRLTSGVREVDLVARFGGDEFALILPSTGVAGALRLAEKVRVAIADEPFELGGEHAFDVSASIGVATYPEHGNIARLLVKAADAALYRAKAAGGNHVEHARVETGRC